MTEENQNHKKSPYRWIKFIVLIAILIIIGVWAFFWVSYRIAHVSSEDAQVAAHEVTVSSRLPGRIDKFSLIIGDHLNKGDFIAQLYSKPDKIKLQKRKAHVTSIKRKLAAQKAHLKVIKTRLVGGIKQTKELLEKDLSAVNVAKAKMIKAKKHATRMQKLYKTGSTTDLSVGQHVVINVDAYPNTKYSGHIKVIGHAATNQFALLPNPNPSGNFTKIAQRIPVRIAIDKGPKKKLSPGMMVEVHIDITSEATCAGAS